MCKSFFLIHNIEKVTIDELLVYMNRRMKLYGIFFIIALVSFILLKDYHPTYLAFTIVTLGLYLLSMLAIFQLRKNPTARTAVYPIITALIVLGFNIFSMVYTLIVHGNLYALITLISIVLQISTLFVLHKLREKLVNRELGRDDDEALEQPIENSSTHDNSAHGSSRNGRSNHGSNHGGHMSMNSTHSNSSKTDIENPVHGGTR